jgi:hypothetical protein
MATAPSPVPQPDDFDRIDAALARIDAALKRGAASRAELERRHAALRAVVAESLGELDAVIGSLES